MGNLCMLIYYELSTSYNAFQQALNNNHKQMEQRKFPANSTADLYQSFTQLSPLRLMVQKQASSYIEDKIVGLKSMSEDFQLKTIRQFGYDTARSDLFTQYVIKNAEKEAASVTLPERSASPYNWRSISSARSDNSPIIVREPADEAKLQLGQTMEHVKKKIETIGSIEEPAIPKIADTLNKLLEARRQKLVKKEKEKRFREAARARSDNKAIFEYLLNLNTQKVPKAFFTRNSLKKPLETRPIVKCLEYSSIPDPEKVLCTYNNKVVFNRNYRWKPLNYRGLQQSRISSAHPRQMDKEVRFMVLKKVNEKRWKLQRVFLWEPVEEEEMGIRGINEFMRETMWRVTYYKRAIKANMEKAAAESLDDSKLTDSELQYLIEGELEVSSVPSEEKLQEDIYSLKNKAEKRRMKRDMRCEETERQEMQQTFGNFNEGIEYLEFPKRGKTKPMTIPADDNDPEHGTTNYYGTIQKRRATTNKFHPRWLVLKGFDLYWYRTSDSKVQKGVIKIGDKYPAEALVKNLRCFSIEEGEGRLLTFLNNENGHTFMVKVGNQICLKKYFDENIKNDWAFDKQIVDFFVDPSKTFLKLNSSVKLNNDIVKCVARSIEYHPKLQELELVQCGITDGQFIELKQAIENGSNNIGKLNLSSNKITHKSAKTLQGLIQAPRNKKLMTLILDNNLLLDVTIQELAQGLLDKYQHLLEEKGTAYICPIEKLSIRKTGIGDRGLIALTHTFDNIATHCRKEVEDFENFLAIDVGGNDIADNGMKIIAQLLTKFHGISSLGVSSLAQVLCQGKQQKMQDKRLY
eukprot:TRINITY_DN3725_c1_g1_i1.p1 TRINITY_DN3725_c1_g1~~TRINITY_DN3725_c1_g1_i1.p1  ORF type:complete len:803 (+),score=91.67 TRINITY_DN3725_c1_g1_i1:5203-7611(+)